MDIPKQVARFSLIKRRRMRTEFLIDSGAFFMRRSLGDDELYREIFTEYTQRLLLDGWARNLIMSNFVSNLPIFILYAGYPVEFFIEGTRSRSGKMLQPKLGLLSIITDLFFEDNQKPSLQTSTRAR